MKRSQIQLSSEKLLNKYPTIMLSLNSQDVEVNKKSLQWNKTEQKVAM